MGASDPIEHYLSTLAMKTRRPPAMVSRPTAPRRGRVAAAGREYQLPPRRAAPGSGRILYISTDGQNGPEQLSRGQSIRQGLDAAQTSAARFRLQVLLPGCQHQSPRSLCDRLRVAKRSGPLLSEEEGYAKGYRGAGFENRADPHSH